MVNGKKIVVILPAYNAAQTLRKTYEEIPFDVVDEVILTDDASTDQTRQIAAELKIPHIIVHVKNKGYGGNQKSCYKTALEINADIVIMLHPDYQYTPRLIPSMAYLIANDTYQVVLGSRILGKGAMKGGMPVYKYMANRILTFFQNLMTGAKLSEYHTGYRAFSSAVLKNIKYEANSDGFIFDNQILSQIILAGYEIAEITCPSKYFKEASSIGFINSLIYGFGVVKTTVEHVLHRIGLIKLNRYEFNKKN